MKYKEISPYELEMSNAFRAVGREWMLIGAEHGGAVNAMTASWGFLGELWGVPAAACFIRPQRYTFPLVDGAGYYSLSFFGGEKRKELSYFGSHSGRDGDKAAACGMRYLDCDAGGVRVPYLDDASVVLICRKLYADDIKEERFVDGDVLEKCYPARDLHRMFVGEVVKCLVSVKD